MWTRTLTLSTRARTDLVAISRQVSAAIHESGIHDGVCTLYVPHTTAGVFINEGYDPDVMGDVERSLDRIIPWEQNYAHMEGNSAAHIKAILVGNSQQVLVSGGSLQLGQWEEIFLAEFDGPRQRRLIVSCLG